MQKNQFLYWKMENGHEHSTLAWNADVLGEFAIENEAGELTQREYQIYVSGKEHTHLINEVVEDFEVLTVELAQKWLDNDYIADFEVDNDEIIIEFY